MIKIQEIQKAKNSLDLWKLANNNGYTTISSSQIKTWQQCPYKWKKIYIDKEKDDKKSIELVFGSAMHTVLQEYVKTMFERTITDADKINFEKRLYEEMVNEFKKEVNSKDYITKKEMLEFYNDGIAILSFFKKKRRSIFYM